MADAFHCDDELHALDRRIAAAAAALNGARAVAWHSPSADNLAAEDKAQQAVDALLDERSEKARAG